MNPREATDFDDDKLPDVAVSREYKHGHKELIRRYIGVANDYSATHPGLSLIVTCVYRSPAEQGRLYKQGRFGNPGPIVTNCNGTSKKSNHNHFPSRALDCAVVDGGKITWDEKYYWPLVALAKKHGLVSGGSWASIQDWPHLELPKDKEA